MPGTAFHTGFCFSSTKVTALQEWLTRAGEERYKGSPSKKALLCHMFETQPQRMPFHSFTTHRKLKIIGGEEHTRLHHRGAESRLNNGYDVRKLEKTRENRGTTRKEGRRCTGPTSRLPNSYLDCLKENKHYRKSWCPEERKLELFGQYQLRFTSPRAKLSSAVSLPWCPKQTV